MSFLLYAGLIIVGIIVGVVATIAVFYWLAAIVIMRALWCVALVASLAAPALAQTTVNFF